MFGNMPLFSNVLPPATPPKDVPPPTPVNFPRYFAELTGGGTSGAPSAEASASTSGPGKNKPPLTALLQGIVRPTEVGLKHFEALGVRIQQDAEPTAVIPGYHSLVPDFATWNDISYDDARELNESTRRPINNGNRSPGIQTYLDRRRELSIDNNAAYRSVRRMQPLHPGQPPVRLGNAYEFYRHLESFSAFWDDTSMAPPPAKDPAKSSKPPSEAGDAHGVKEADGQGEKSGDVDGGDGNESGCDSVSSASSTAVTTDSESKPSSPAKDGASSVPEFRFYRTSAGNQMPPEFRLNIITAFLKLVAYDFGCNVSAPRMEPRLYLNAGTISLEEVRPLDKLGQKEKESQEQTATPPTAASKSLKTSKTSKPPPSSYFSSGCIFVFRSPTTREAARAGIVEGPLAAVSARHTTTFSSPEDSPTDKDSSLDLARELVAALLTAQHRARDGRAEKRIGKDEWWATKPRWGGGPGGPIGREVDSAPNTDEVLVTTDTAEGSGSSGSSGSSGIAGVAGASSSSSSSGGSSGPPRPPRFSTRGGGPSTGGGGGGRSNLMSALESAYSITDVPVRGGSKKPRKGLAIYDNYRMVRPPSSSWDKKTRYMALGKAAGAEYDDIFVISALFHHMSIVRVRVPLRLLEALDGEEETGTGADWAGLDVVRSPWYDFFKVEDRLKAMQLSWAMMAYLMREQDTDVKMDGAA
ncbi:hypothetical protein SCUCBS95973_008261 [Sporothrix curviconia]|uniref:Uncharacterized protein n=1 Tax=Sporothrix curviconia TaxID=1260050 RepID=A0ABP0CK49_9PEZI